MYFVLLFLVKYFCERSTMTTDAQDHATTDLISTIFQTYANEPRLYTPRYGFAWALADHFVRHYYPTTGLDAISMVVGGVPSYALKLTAERSCSYQKRGGAPTLGSIQFASGSVDNWRKLDDTRYEFAKEIIAGGVAPDVAVARAVRHVDSAGWAKEQAGDHSLCSHTFLAQSYPRLFSLITGLIVRTPSLTAEREVWVDVEPTYSDIHDTPTHPLRQLGLAEMGPTYDFFGLKNNESGRSIFIDITTSRLVHYDGSEWRISGGAEWFGQSDADAAAYLLRLLAED